MTTEWLHVFVVEYANLLGGLVILLVLSTIMVLSNERRTATEVLQWCVISTSAATAIIGVAALVVWKPVFGSAIVISLSAAIIWKLTGFFPQWWAGVQLFVRNNLQLGDYIITENHRGRLSRAGLFRAHLVAPNGADIFVPWHKLSNTVQVLSKNAHWLVEVQIQLPTIPTREERHLIEVQAIYCPYRVWSKPVKVQSDPDRPATLHVRLWSWSADARDLAVDYLLRAIPERCAAPKTSGTT